MSNLNLIPTDDLIDELMNRTNGLVLAFLKTEENNKEFVYTRWTPKNNYIELIGIVRTLEYQILEEYNKEVS